MQMGIALDDRMMWINQDNFVPKVSTILPNPIRIQDNEIMKFLLDTLFRNLLIVFTQVHSCAEAFWLSTAFNLRTDMPATDCALTDDENSLLGFIPQRAGAIETCRPFQFDRYRISSPLNQTLFHQFGHGLFGTFPCFP